MKGSQKGDVSGCKRNLLKTEVTEVEKVLAVCDLLVVALEEFFHGYWWTT